MLLFSMHKNAKLDCINLNSHNK